MKLIDVHKTFLMEDGSGYNYRIEAIYDPEFGWSGHVSMHTHGFKDADAAIQHLRHAAERFLQQLKESDGNA